MNVLLVDDDAIILEDIRRSIHWDRLGIDEIYTALDVEQARAVLRAHTVDVTVSDIEMPRETGLELLQWCRDQGYQGKFLLLTSYGKFEYASEALRLRAEEYLLKPFNVRSMELALQRAVEQRRQELLQEQEKALGSWVVTNAREVRLSIWQRLLGGGIGAGDRELIEKLRGTSLEIDTAASYRLVLIRATNLEEDYESFDPNLVSFMLTNIASEVLTGRPENENVLCSSHPGFLLLSAVCPALSDEELRERCLRLRKSAAEVLASTLTLCVMEPRGFFSMGEAARRGAQLLEKNVAYYGEVFLESRIPQGEGGSAPLPELERLSEYLDSGNRREFMACLKRTLDASVQSGTLDGMTLRRIHREVRQAIYSHLSRRQIQISLLLNDPLSERIVARAEQSASDLLRCESYLLDRILACEQELARSEDFVVRVNEYIHRHYAENIGRNEIGQAFFLVPEYLAKLYKKKSGVNLKDYINDYRITRAKALLLETRKSVSEVAMDVGFDNLSYFSTLFKKSTGMTPVEFRRQQS